MTLIFEKTFASLIKAFSFWSSPSYFRVHVDHESTFQVSLVRIQIDFTSMTEQK